MRSFLSYAFNTMTAISPHHRQVGLNIALSSVQILTLKNIFDTTIQETISNLMKSHWTATNLSLLCGALGELSAWMSPMTVKESFAVSSFMMSVNILMADASAYISAKNIFSQASPIEAEAAAILLSGLRAKYYKLLLMIAGISAIEVTNFLSADYKDLWMGSIAGGYLFSTYSFFYCKPLMRSLMDPETAKYLSCDHRCHST